MQGLQLLRTERADGVMLDSMARESISGPAMI